MTYSSFKWPSICSNIALNFLLSSSPFFSPSILTSASYFPNSSLTRLKSSRFAFCMATSLSLRPIFSNSEIFFSLWAISSLRSSICSFKWLSYASISSLMTFIFSSCFLISKCISFNTRLSNLSSLLSKMTHSLDWISNYWSFGSL